MRILELDKETGHILIEWYEDTEYPQVLNHVIPEVLMENPSMSKEEIYNLLALEKPDPIEPVFKSLNEVPKGLLDLIESQKEDADASTIS